MDQKTAIQFKAAVGITPPGLVSTLALVKNRSSHVRAANSAFQQKTLPSEAMAHLARIDVVKRFGLVSLMRSLHCQRQGGRWRSHGERLEKGFAYRTRRSQIIAQVQVEHHHPCHVGRRECIVIALGGAEG